jgi:putative sterol carrier protein
MQIFDHGHHLWASAWYLLGDIERVSAWIDSVDGIIDSPATIMWKYAKQMCYGVCEYTHAPQLHIPSDYYANDEWWEIAGTAGILRVNRCTGKLNEGPSLSLFQGKKWKHYGNLKADWVEGFKNATKNFVDAIHGKSEPVLNGKQARDIMRFALAIGRAARERREVYIEEMEYGPSRGRRFSQKKIKAARRKQKQDRPSWLERMGITQDLSKYAPRARDLTYDLLQKFDPEKVADWRAEVGLFLTAEGEAAEQKFVLRIGDSQASLDEGDIPSRASLVIEASPGAWAAVLLKKKRLETAFLQGKIKIVKGKAEDALKLRAAFQL